MSDRIEHAAAELSPNAREFMAAASAGAPSGGPASTEADENPARDERARTDGGDRLSDERLRQLAFDEYVCSNENERSMAAELLEARSKLAEHGTVAIEWLAAHRRVAELERQLREEGNSVGRLEDQLRTACTEGADARARVAELEATRPRVIERAEDLDVRPIGTVVRTDRGRTAEKTTDGYSSPCGRFHSGWMLTQSDEIECGTDELDDFPITVIWSPPCYRCGADHDNTDELCAPCVAAVGAEVGDPR